MYIYIIYIYYIYIYIYHNSICFITKALNIIHKQHGDLYQNDKEIKSSHYVNVRHSLQSGQSKLTLSVQGNSLKNTLSSDKIGLIEN